MAQQGVPEGLPEWLERLERENQRWQRGVAALCIIFKGAVGRRRRERVVM
jgi:hypothetical protein